MDADLDQMSREQLIEEVRRLRNGIRAHRDSKMHDLCWHHPALWGLLPEKTDAIPVVPSWPEFIRGCVRLMCRHLTRQEAASPTIRTDPIQRQESSHAGDEHQRE